MHPINIPPRFFVTGTDTGVGKTLVSAILMAGLNAAYWKPVQSGKDEMTDSAWIRRVTGFAEDAFLPETYRLKQPLSPHAAAACDGVRIQLAAFNMPDHKKYPRLIVEGAGGVMVPLNENQFMVDLMKYLDLPVLVVARSTLGTINHTLLTLEMLRQSRLEILGVILNGPPNEINKDAIQTYGHISVMAEVDVLPQLNFQTVSNAYRQFFR